MAKVKKPALSAHDQEVQSVTAVATPGVIVTKPYGLVKVTSASSGFVQLADGDYNGQKVILYQSDNSNDTLIVNSSVLSAAGTTKIDASEGDVVVLYWYHDGSSGQWYGFNGDNDGN
jgi:hypothetical protein